MKDKEKQIEICENCKIKENCSHRILVNMEKCKVNDCDYFQNISTDKEKQIELMAKRIHIATDLYYIECIKIATYLFEKDNCRIIDKDNVMLSKEELNEIINQTKETEKNYYKRVVIPQECKETAEKFLQLAYDRCLEKSFIKKVEELAKSLGAEIKE